MRRFSIRDLCLAALIAALYAVLTVALPIPQYGGVQLRAAEAMTVLPFLFPAATPGLVGAEIAWFETGFGPGFWQAFGFNALTVGLGELIACVLLGELLLSALPRVPVLHPYLAQRRQMAK